MWTYQYVDRKDILHYGVPGMKWGVRKQRAQMRREAGVLSRDLKVYKRQAARTSAKISKRQAAGKTVSNKLASKNQAAKRAISRINKKMSSTYKSLSAKDIKRGRRQTSVLLSATLGIREFSLARRPGGGLMRKRDLIRARAYAR